MLIDLRIHVGIELGRIGLRRIVCVIRGLGRDGPGLLVHDLQSLLGQNPGVEEAVPENLDGIIPLLPLGNLSF